MKCRDYESALELCTAAFEAHPRAYRILAERADVHERMGDLPKAIEDISSVIAMRPREPKFFFERCLLWIKQGSYEKAVADATDLLRLCDEWRNDYYREIAHFFRAFAAVRLNRPADALADCEQIRHDCFWWLQGALCRPSDIIDEAKDRLAHAARARGG